MIVPTPRRVRESADPTMRTVVAQYYRGVFPSKQILTALACGVPLGGIAAAGLAGWFK